MVLDDKNKDDFGDFGDSSEGDDFSSGDSFDSGSSSSGSSEGDSSFEQSPFDSFSEGAGQDSYADSSSSGGGSASGGESDSGYVGSIFSSDASSGGSGSGGGGGGYGDADPDAEYDYGGGYQDDEEKSGGSGKFIIVIILLGILFLGAGGAFLWWKKTKGGGVEALQEVVGIGGKKAEALLDSADASTGALDSAQALADNTLPENQAAALSEVPSDPEPVKASPPPSSRPPVRSLSSSTQVTKPPKRASSPTPYRSSGSGGQGGVDVLSASTGQSYIIVGSFVDGDGAQNFAKKISNKGYRVKIIMPYGSSPSHRVAVGEFPTYREAAQNISRFTAEFGSDLWVFRYR